MQKVPKNILFFFIVAIMFVVFGQIDKNCSAEDITSRSKAILNSIVEQVRKMQKLPVMVDNETEWTSVSAGNGEFISKYKMLEANAENMNKNSFRLFMKKHLLSSGVCGKGNNKNAVLAHGMDLRYIYYDKFGNLIGSLTITPQDCGF